MPHNASGRVTENTQVVQADVLCRCRPHLLLWSKERLAKWLVSVVLLLFLGALRSSPDSAGAIESDNHDPGALVRLTAESTVGVGLDELPLSIRADAAKALIARPDSFWRTRAQRQINLMSYRLVFRTQFYPGENRQQLPLPPKEVRFISFEGKPHRSSIDGHDLVVVRYQMRGVLLTTPDSPAITEPNLAKSGGVRVERFTLPIDPELVFQRTRFACMDEAEFPPLSVDSEEVDTFYDDSCNVEPALSNTGCHQTEMPTESCMKAVKDHIGHVDVALVFRRLKWDDELANRVRTGAISNPDGANLTPEASEFRVHRLVYRYIPAGDCSLSIEEGPCVGGAGWRRLLQFSTADRNTGTKTLTIGSVDYFNSTGGSDLSRHHVFEYSTCHHHYHFRHYGEFSFNNEQSPQKRGFCLQSTNRFSNNEFSPLHNPFGDCRFQGIEVGWVDEYKAGLLCQWKDVTDIDTSAAPLTGPLTFTSNPDGFLCEGIPVLDPNGDPVFEPTPFKTEKGEPVDRMKCNFWPAWFDDNFDSYDVTLPRPGEGYVTASCTAGQTGPLRNCEFHKDNSGVHRCRPGTKVHLACEAQRVPQVVRVCEASIALGTGLACTFQDALANQTLASGSADVTFTCPSARDTVETGGRFALYVGPAFNDDSAVPVNCTRK
jgi:hypothetical protein